MNDFSKKILIVDGYNVLRSSDFYDPTDDWTDEHYNHARESLLNDIASCYDHTVIIVYDAAKRPSHKKIVPFTKINLNKTNTIFTATEITADEQIEKLAYEAIEQNYKVTIATSDNIIRTTTSNKHITFINAKNFCEVISTKKHETNFHVNTSKTKITDSLTPETIKKLENLKNSL